jgi:transcription initiation factor IIF auxiliary subunit
MGKAMDYRIEQSYQYKDDNWWEWSVWVEPEDRLDEVEYVQYTLHHTFSNPVRRVNDRSSRFKLTTGGWGTFTIYAKIVTKSGREYKLTHELELQYPDQRMAPT